MSRVTASPSVRALARKKGIDLEELATRIGRDNISREDVEPSHATRPQRDMSLWDVNHAAFGPVTTEPLSQFALLVSSHLSAANSTIPQVTHHDRADVSVLEAFRNRLKPEAGERGIRLTSLSFHLKALARALREFPRFNASLSADGKSLVLKHYVHLGVAVDTSHGLMVPVIRDVDRKGLWKIATEISDLATRAEARKIRPDEMGGASMTISSLGSIGGTAFTPIVNPPELAILGITRIETATVWDGYIPRPAPMLPLDLSYDHRVINGAEAARFMVYLAGLLEDPYRIMI